MMGVPCEGHVLVHGDSISIVFSTAISESILKNELQTLAYYLIREGVARDEWRTYYVTTLTKVLPHGEKIRGFVKKMIHRIFRIFQ